jgi:hypothetical protein
VLNGLRVQTAVVSCLLVAVASGAGDFGWLGLVGRSLDVGMAIHAGEHATVHRALELNRIDIQSHTLAVDVMGEAGVAMAGKAVFVRGLLRGNRVGAKQQGQEQEPHRGCGAHHRSQFTYL